MEIVLIILTGVLTGTLLVSAYYLGYSQGIKKEQPKEGLELTEDNAELIKNMLAWRNYRG